MAGIAALLDRQMLGAPQGNLNPQLYSLAASMPSAFHDTTVASSGVTTCDVNTPSMCNNSIPGASGSAAQAGFLLQPGYDEATGLGSLDVNVFLNNYSVPKTTPTVTVNLSSSSITSAQPLTVTITVSGNVVTSPTPTGTVTLSGGGYTTAAVPLMSGSITFGIRAGSLAAGTDALTVSYTPDTITSRFYNAASASSSVTVTTVPKITPAVTLAFSPTNPTTAQELTVTMTVAGGSGNQIPTGAVTLTGTGFSSDPATLVNGSIMYNLPASSLQSGVNNLTAAYTPDQTSSSIYNSASGSSPITITAIPKITPAVTVTATPWGYGPSITSTDNISVQISVDGGTGNVPPYGTVKLAVGSFSVSGYVNGSVNLEIPAGSIPYGNDTLTVTYTPIAYSTSVYNTASGSTTVTVTMVTPRVAVMPTLPSITTAQGLTVLIGVQGSGGQTPTGSVTLTSGSYSSGAIKLVSGSASIAVPAGALALGADTLSAAYTPDSSSSNFYGATTGSSTVTVTAVPPPSYTVSGTAVTVAAGATTGNSSTITITPWDGFTGSVALTATITGPSGAQNTPTLSFGSTTPVSLTYPSSGTATLTISTTARQTSCKAANETPRGIPWYAQGGAVLACILLFGLAPRRSKGRTILGMLLLLVALAGGMLACGGGSGGGGQNTACTTTTTGGTTAGSYTITITGTSGSTTASNTITLTVQ